MKSEIFFNGSILTSNTSLMMFITALLKFFLRFDILVHLAFSIISFIGLKYLIQNISTRAKDVYVLIFFFLMPSFGMWTSTIVKESLSCFFSCFVLIWLLKVIKKEKIGYVNLCAYIICLYFTTLLRPIVGVSLSISLFIIVCNNFKFANKYIKFIFIFSSCFIFASIIFLLASQYIQKEFIPMAKYYFDPKFTDSKSLRDVDFWVNVEDFYLKAPQGIFIANLGPNILESINKPFYLPYFFEGILFIYFIFYWIFFICKDFISKAYFDTNFVFLFFSLIVLILFLNYPFGLFNPGSATRYRSSYYHIIISILYYYYTKSKAIFI
ncbi:hypothetical protein ACMH5Q_11215 [Aquirufa lenticrescens]